MQTTQYAQWAAREDDIRARLREYFDAETAAVSLVIEHNGLFFAVDRDLHVSQPFATQVAAQSMADQMGEQIALDRRLTLTPAERAIGVPYFDQVEGPDGSWLWAKCPKCGEIVGDRDKRGPGRHWTSTHEAEPERGSPEWGAGPTDDRPEPPFGIDRLGIGR